MSEVPVAKPRFAGVELPIGDRVFVVPPMNLGRLKQVQPLLGRLERMESAEDVDAIVKVVHTALTRNYPDLTIAEVEELVDLGSLPGIIDAVMNISGLAPKGPAQQPRAAVAP